MSDVSSTHPQEVPDPAPNSDTERVVDSDRILGTASSVWIRHRGFLYRLMKTKQGKLILTK